MNYYQVLLFVLGKPFKFGFFFEKITNLIQKHIGLWNIPLVKCIK